MSGLVEPSTTGILKAADLWFDTHYNLDTVNREVKEYNSLVQEIEELQGSSHFSATDPKRQESQRHEHASRLRKAMEEANRLAAKVNPL